MNWVPIAKKKQKDDLMAYFNLCEQRFSEEDAVQ